MNILIKNHVRAMIAAIRRIWPSKSLISTESGREEGSRAKVISKKNQNNDHRQQVRALKKIL